MVKVPYTEAPPAPSGLVAENGSGASGMNIRASADSFGAPAAEGLGKVGNVLEQQAQQITGMVMETAANQAELAYVKETSPIIAKYKSLQGLEAYAAKDKFQQEILKVNQGIRSNLPGGAQRMFDSNTARSAASAIRDYDSYATSQLKRATLDSNNAVGEAAVNRAGNPSVAADETQWGHVVGDIQHAVGSMMELQGWGGHTVTDPETGKVSFPDTPEGKQAEAVYQAEMDKRVGPAWENRLRTLADQNVPDAYKVFKENRDKIPGDAQVKMEAYFTPKMRDYDARTTADEIITSHAREYKSSVLTPGAAQNDISSAIHQQESSGRAHDYQIQEGTFKQYAEPGERFDNPEDHDKVYGRIINDLQKSYPGDTARQAVAYFSGKGNVSLPGSDTPWKVDHTDGNKRVSQYVADIEGRVGAAPAPKKEIPTTALVPSEADYYRANYDGIVEQTRARAQAQHPDDPSFADNAVARVEQRMAGAIKGQEMAYKADNDMVLKASQGGFSPQKLAPRNMEELKATSPEVSAALDRMAVNDWKAYEHVQNKILVANARGNDKDMREYGRGFYKLFQAVHADANDPDRINNVKQLYEHIGPDGDLTMAGLDKLNGELNGKNTPEGSAEGDMRKHFFANAKDQISGKNDMFGLPDSKGEEQYLKFMAQTFPLIEKLRTEGKTAAQIYNPDSPDYVGKLISAFKRPLNVQLQDMQRDAQGLGGAGGGIATQTKNNTVRTPAKIAAEARATTDPKIREVLKQELIRMGAIRDDGPKVPGPE